MPEINPETEQTKTARQLHDTEFPTCASLCAALNYLGAGECGSVCPHKLAPNIKGEGLC